MAWVARLMEGSLRHLWLVGAINSKATEATSTQQQDEKSLESKVLSRCLEVVEVSALLSEYYVTNAPIDFDSNAYVDGIPIHDETVVNQNTN